MAGLDDIDRGPGNEMGKSKTEESQAGYEVQCWGCSQTLLLPSFAPIFKCGWCGALTVPKGCKPARSRWKIRLIYVRDRAFVGTVGLVIASIVCGGVWATFPVLFLTFSPGLLFHSALTSLLAFNTFFNFSLSSYVAPGPVGKIGWGDLVVVKRGGLEGHSFCEYCKNPKPASAHHCRTCGSCVLDMDHHCPFIGNCVGANNHRHFLLFLFYTVISCIYVFMMTLYTGLEYWPSVIRSNRLGNYTRARKFVPTGFNLGGEFFEALFNSSFVMSARALALFYLMVTSIAVGTGVGVLLYQQVALLYKGQTLLDALYVNGKLKDGGGWDNLWRLFGSRHPLWWLLPQFNADQSSTKVHIR